MKRKEGAVIYWAPRVLSITLIIFLVFFSFDVFGNGLGFWQTLAAFLMHNIPAILLTALLITAWKREIVGAVTFFTAGLLYVTFVISAIIREGFEWHYLAWIAQIAVPAFLAGALFLIGWRRKRTKQQLQKAAGE